MHHARLMNLLWSKGPTQRCSHYFKFHSCLNRASGSWAPSTTKLEECHITPLFSAVVQINQDLAGLLLLSAALTRFFPCLGFSAGSCQPSSCYFCSGSGQLSQYLWETRSGTPVGFSLPHPQFLAPNPIICTICHSDSHLEVIPLTIKISLSGGFSEHSFHHVPSCCASPTALLKLCLLGAKSLLGRRPEWLHHFNVNL